MLRIKIEKLEKFCETALISEGMPKENAKTVATVLVETDALGTNSHGTKNLHNYIRKMRAGGLSIDGEAEIIKEGQAFAIVDAHNTLGMIPSCFAMDVATKKAKETGIAIVSVRNSSHFGAASYYSNMAAKEGLMGITFSNVDPNMSVPGSRGMLIGNNPFSYAVPAKSTPTIFLDIAMSNVASLKVIQARNDGESIPDSWIVDKDGIPTTDPSNYPDEGAMQPFARHKGYGIALLVDLITGGLNGGAMSMSGGIVSWLFQMEAKNNVSHTFIAIDPDAFVGREKFLDSVEKAAEALRGADKAKGSDRIYTPGEMEWERYADAEANGIVLPPDLYESLKGLSDELDIELEVINNE
ncbi:MAG: Ldh family oxidoreductase [Fastidiosipila sp.]|nr:Ldh family oxidoreductase [Fastidiosipila sp.]